MVQNGAHFGDTVLGSRCCPIGENRSEVGGVVPKHEAPYREFNVAAAVRDVSCVTCRACDVARATDQSEVGGVIQERSGCIPRTGKLTLPAPCA